MNEGCLWLFRDDTDEPFAWISADHLIAVDGYNKNGRWAYLRCTHGRYMVRAESIKAAAGMVAEARSGKQVSTVACGSLND